MKSMAEHLTDHCRTLLKDFGRDHGRNLIRQNIPVWREAYGQSVARQVTKNVMEILAGKG